MSSVTLNRMDARTIVKFMALIALVALLYKVWQSGKKTGYGTVRPYNPYIDFDSEIDMNMDMEMDMEDMDMEDMDMEDMDMDMDMEMDMEMGIDTNDMEMMDDDAEEDYEDTTNDYSGDMSYEEDYEVDTSSMSKYTMPHTTLMSPSSQLLPKQSVQAQDFAQFAPSELGAQNFLTATQWIGVNTQGSSLRNANYDIRANPVIPKADVGPWFQSTIDPDVYARPLF